MSDIDIVMMLVGIVGSLVFVVGGASFSNNKKESKEELAFIKQYENSLFYFLKTLHVAIPNNEHSAILQRFEAITVKWLDLENREFGEYNTLTERVAYFNILTFHEVHMLREMNTSLQSGVPITNEQLQLAIETVSAALEEKYEQHIQRMLEPVKSELAVFEDVKKLENF